MLLAVNVIKIGMRVLKKAITHFTMPTHSRLCHSVLLIKKKVVAEEEW